MENKTLTPEQHEMEVYENYLECFGEENVIAEALDAMNDASKVLEIIDKAMEIGDAPIDNPAVQDWVRYHIAEAQVYLNMMELIFGDTAEDACDLISSLSENINT